MHINLESRPVPRIRPEDFTIWVARSDGPIRSYSVWRGPRTVQALNELLAKLDACGFPSTLELESSACGPVETTVPELLDLGVVTAEHPITKARAFLRSLVRRSQQHPGRRS